MLFLVKWVLVIGFVLAFEGVCVETQWVFWVYLGFLGLLGFFGFKWVYLLFSDLSI